jgi:cell division protein FtsB
MSDGVLIAVLSLVGTGLGTLGGILATNKLVMFRLESLEKKVEKHNNLVERMTVVEQKTNFLEQEVKDIKDVA